MAKKRKDPAQRAAWLAEHRFVQPATERVGRRGPDGPMPAVAEKAARERAGRLGERESGGVGRVVVRPAEIKWRWVKVPSPPVVVQPAAGSPFVRDCDAADKAAQFVLGARLKADRDELNQVVVLRESGFTWQRIADVFATTRRAHRLHLDRLCRERGWTIADLG